MTPDVVRFRQADVLAALHRRFGPVVRLGPYTYLLGPEANRFVFANAQLFRVEEAFQALVPVDGPTSLIVSDGEDHRRRRRLVQPALHHRQIAGYVKVMADNADATIDAWRPGQVVDVYQEFRAAIRRSTIQSLFGRRLAGDAEFFGTELQALLDLIDRNPPVVAWLRRLRTPTWRRAMAARARVDARIYAEIARVRAGEGDADDNVLSTLVHGRDEDGCALSDLEIRDQAVTLIAAGYETTSAAMAWAVFSLLRHRTVWDRAKAEVDAAGEDLKRLPYLTSVVNETLRLYPPAVVSARTAAQDFEFAGRRIKQGTFLLYSPYVTHRLPDVWPDPLRFDPDRWSRKPAPHEFLPFGGGPHRCVGATLATTELTVMLARLLARAELKLVPQRVTPTSVAAMRPKYGVLAEVTRSA
ncbi:putative cytochrome P450 139 [Lentzea sp. NBRC 105346]|uniref:cytochrome P450 n=1 Tax=Lentzea sp. NBRC 105346 TaxID=3032205 RepID=UPI0025547130|nr:cytochrome P450 [Lentzea sp. NBRC 105346]GLZ34060.1 putative cytochrome P450 139 [Lentzea sp. NBRC 105346]